MKWLDCGLKMVSNFSQFGPRIGHNVIQQRNNHVIQNFLVDTSIDFDPWPDFQIHHFNLAPVYFLSCFKKFLGLDLYLQINQSQNWVREDKLVGYPNENPCIPPWGRSQTTLTRFCLFLTTYPPALTFCMVWTLTRSGHFKTTSYLVNVVCKQNPMLKIPSETYSLKDVKSASILVNRPKKLHLALTEIPIFLFCVHSSWVFWTSEQKTVEKQ